MQTKGGFLKFLFCTRLRSILCPLPSLKISPRKLQDFYLFVMEGQPVEYPGMHGNTLFNNGVHSKKLLPRHAS
jgi:hypothetical protein